MYSAANAALYGSSPWARGTLLNGWRDSGGITVHPRGHGEHYSADSLLPLCCGSSPWARGTLDYNNMIDGGLRFIPVGTGNTLGNRSAPQNVSVHPRGHGEHIVDTV